MSIITELTQHMFTGDFFNNLKKSPIYNKPVQQDNNYKSKKQCNIIKNVNNIFLSKDNDILFWTFFIMLYDIDTYNLTKRSFQYEKTLKFKMIDKININKDKLKKQKIKLAAFINDLGNSSTISLTAFIGLCCLYDKNIILIKNKLMCHYNFNIDKDVYYIFDVTNNTFHLKTTLLNEIKGKYIN